MKKVVANLSLLLSCCSLVACLGVGGEVRTETASPAASASVAVPPSPGPVPSAAQVRLAVERALPYLEEHGVAWMEEHQCVSCHQIPAMVWSFNEAAARGLAVDRQKLDEWNLWTIARSQGPESDNADGMNQLILGRPPTADGDYEALAELVARAQKADGSWKAGGQLPMQRRPTAETHLVSTAWSVLALASVGESGEALERGRELLAAQLSEEGESHEWSVVRLLYENRFGHPEKVRELAAELLAAQSPDGGWAWIPGEPSDAFATGQTLYALERAGWPQDDAAVERARQFLVGTQQDDGSWLVRSTLRSEDGPRPTSNFWGTGWAVIGLLRSLPDEDARSDIVSR